MTELIEYEINYFVVSVAAMLDHLLLHCYQLLPLL